MADMASSLRRSWHKTLLAVRSVSALSPRTIRAILANSARMSRLDRRDRAREAAPSNAVTSGRLLTGAETVVGGEVVGATIAFERATLVVTMVAKDMVLLDWGPDDEPVAWSRHGAPGVTPPDDVSVVIDGPLISITTSLITVTVGDAGVEILDAAGTSRYRELAPLRRGPSRVHRRILRPDERISGLGEIGAGLDLRGGRHRLWNRDPGGAWGPGQDPLYCSIPVTFSRHADGGALAFHENTHDGVAVFSTPLPGKTSDVEIRWVGGSVRTWVVLGDHPTMLERYCELTGRHSVPPRWSLGYHQSRWGYGSSAELDEVVTGFSDRQIPLSAIHLDIDYMDGYRVFTVDKEHFSGLVDLAARSGEVGTRLVTIVDPAIRKDPGFDVYDQGIEEGHFVAEESGQVHVGTVWPGRAVFPDFTREATRSWWSGLVARLVDHGIAGLWHDMNEPTSLTLSGDRTIPRSARHDNDGRGGDHRESHNVYGLLMNRAGAEGLREAAPLRRPFIVSRSGWAGMQRDAWLWTGDVESSPLGLAQQIPTFLGLGLSGVSFVGSDIGGFSGIPSPELYLRWLELGVVSPFCRTHSVLGAPPREPWCWPHDVQDRIEALIRFRYRLLPLLYTEAALTAATGSPMLRPLWWGSESASGEIDGCEDEMLVGDRLLFALMTDGSDTTRPVVLPPGWWWLWRPGALPTDAHDEVTLFAGGRTVVVEGRVGQPLLFVRSGSVLPLDDAWLASRGTSPQLRADHGPQALAFHLFEQEGTAAGTAFDDEGDGGGPVRWDHLEMADGVVTWTTEGDRPKPSEVTVVLHGRAVTAASADGVALASGAIDRRGTATVLRLGAFERLVLGD